MKIGSKSFIIIISVAVSVCSLLLLGSFFKVGFLQSMFSHSVEMHPLTVISLMLAVFSLMLIFTISIGKLRGSRNITRKAFLKETEIREEVETKLNESNRLLDGIIENFPDIIFVKDSNLRYVKINKVTSQFLGRNKDEVIGFTDHDLFSAKEATAIQLRDKEILHTKRLSSLYEQKIVIGNKEHWLSTRKFPVFDEAKEPKYIVGIARDITEQKKQQEQTNDFYKELELKVNERTIELFKSEQRFKSLIENGIDVISMTDANGVLLYVSPSVKNVMGYTDVELMAKPGNSFIYPDDVEIAQTLFNKVINEPGVPKTSTLRVSHKDGHPVWVEGTIINQLHEENVGAIITNYHDITDRLKFEEQKQKLEAALLDEKIKRQKQITQATLDGQEKERTAIGMEMHDNINQILGVIKLYLGLAKTRPELINEMIEKSLENIVLCIKETRKLSKSLVTTNISKYGLHFAIQDLIDDFKEAGLNFIYTVDEDKLLGLDSNLQFSLYRIIQEQINNIVKHAQATQVLIKIECVDDLLQLEITDNGKGFDTTVQHRGIGLSNIQNRVDLLNGHFEIISSLNKGCTLKVSMAC